MKIHCIHHETRTDRLELLKKEIEDHSLDVQLWPAIFDTVMRFRGVCKAHKQIVEWAAREGKEMVCIAEDDFHLFAPGAWEYFLQNIPDDFDLYLSGIFNGYIHKDNTVQQFTGLHLYIVSKRFYCIFLSLPEEMNLDYALTNKGRFVVCNPFVATQHNGWSDNNQQKLILDHYLNGRNIFKGKYVWENYNMYM